jgi:hypothetical protein
MFKETACFRNAVFSVFRISGNGQSMKTNNSKEIITNNNNSVALVHKRTVPTEQPLLVGEDSANFCG